MELSEILHSMSIGETVHDIIKKSNGKVNPGVVKEISDMSNDLCFYEAFAKKVKEMEDDLEGLDEPCQLCGPIIRFDTFFTVESGDKQDCFTDRNGNLYLFFVRKQDGCKNTIIFGVSAC